MPQSNMHEIAKRIIVFLSLEMKTFKNEFLAVSQFVEELESVNFALTYKKVEKKINSKDEVLVLLNALCLDSKYQFEGLTPGNITRFNWTNIYDGMESKDLFIDGMFASRLLGLDGYFVHNRISAGLMLILPGVVYPFHTHRVKEFYYCLSGELLIQHDIDGEKFSLGQGELSFTPEGKLHSLEVIGNKPVLLAYSWLGNLNTPIRIWEKIDSRLWKGCVWKRLPGEKWKTTHSQQLTNQDFLNLFSRYYIDANR